MNRRMAGVAMIALLGLLLVGVAGCGGDDDISSTTALTKQEFLDQGNAICEAGNKATEAESEEVFSDGQPTDDEFEQFATDVLVPSIQGQIDDIRALGTPEGDDGEVSEILDSAESDLDDLKSDPSIIASGDPFAETNQALESYGLTVCAGS